MVTLFYWLLVVGYGLLVVGITDDVKKNVTYILTKLLYRTITNCMTTNLIIGLEDSTERSERNPRRFFGI